MGFRKIITIILVLLLTSGMANCICAQTNDSIAKKKMRELFVRAYNDRRNASCLPLADSLYQMAIAAHNRQAEIDALNVRFLYEFYQPNNIANVEKQMKPLLAKAEEYGMTNIYYQTITNKALYHLREHRYLDAIAFIDKEMEHARKQNSVAGIRSCYRTMGLIFQYRDQMAQAVYYYKKGIDYGTKHDPDHNPLFDYLSLADCYRNMGDYKSMMNTLNEAEPFITNSLMKRNFLAFRAYAKAMTGDIDGFLADDQTMVNIRGSIQNIPTQLWEALKAYKAIAEHRDKDAEQVIANLKELSSREYFRVQAFYQQQRGNYKASSEWTKQELDFHYDYNKNIFERDKENREAIFTDLNIQQERRRIKNANTQLQLINTQQALHNSELELERSHDATHLAKAEAHRDSLSAERQMLNLVQLKDSITTNNLDKMLQDRHMRLKNYLLNGALLLVLMILALLTVHYLRRRILVKRIKKTNCRMEETIKSLDLAQQKSHESEMMKTRFIQNMSHEIRTPLNAIVGFADVLTVMEDELTDEEKADITMKICDNSNMLTTLVNDILDLTSLESGQFDMRMKVVNVNTLCRDAIETIKGKQPLNVALRFTTNIDDSFTTTTDPYRVKQVLLNLLSNAQKNTEQGYILLDCTVDAAQRWLTLSVTDTGVGVPKEKMSIIFERYNKLDLNKQGSGLGLDICRIIAKRLGGEIDIDRQYHQGARFWFKIPINK